MHSINWDDLRYVLAVADSGSVAAAARNLNVNHATVLRRIAAWEEANGVDVFERSAQGYQLRPECAALIDAARGAAQAMDAVARLASGPGPGRADVLRLTSVDTLCQALLAPNWGRIAATVAPSKVALLSSNERLDMARLHADVAIRPVSALPGDMAGDKVGVMGFAAYGKPGAPGSWLAGSGALSRSPASRWMAEAVNSDEIAGWADSFPALLGMAEAGQGRVVLPCILGDQSAVLRRLDVDLPNLAIPLWVGCHRDLTGNPRLRDLRQVVSGLIEDHACILSGVRDPPSTTRLTTP